jgi:hypothetical protein
MATPQEERQTLHEWILQEEPQPRPIAPIEALSLATLSEGLKFVRRRIGNAVQGDISYYEEWRSLMEETTDYNAQAYAYPGWRWSPPPEDGIDRLSKEAVMRFLITDAALLDTVCKSCRAWKRSIANHKASREQIDPSLQQDNGNCHKVNTDRQVKVDV